MSRNIDDSDPLTQVLGGPRSVKVEGRDFDNTSSCINESLDGCSVVSELNASELVKEWQALPPSQWEVIYAMFPPPCRLKRPFPVGDEYHKVLVDRREKAAIDFRRSRECWQRGYSSVGLLNNGAGDKYF